MPERETIEAIFLETVELPLEHRQPFLDQRCAGNPELKAAVEQLIAADRQAGDGAFLRSDLFGKDESAGAEISGANPPAGSEGDRFRVIRAHRQGGLGEVLIAHDRQLDRDVAVKQIKPHWKDSLEAQQRFVQEAKVTGRLEHPGIVPVYAMGNWPDGQPYYAMRFIEGDTMKDAIEKYHRLGDDSSTADDRRLQLRELLTRFVDVCNTIQYAHSKHVLHRDIKPSNIMVGPYGETLVVDWGLAKLLDEPTEESMTADLARALAEAGGSTPTQVGGTVGTPNYMSPEQAKGALDEIGTRTDVYLLGATLYQILTGQPPHQEDSITRLLKRICDGTLTPPREIAPDSSAALQAVCLKAMSNAPTDRYADANEIADDINRWMADQPVSVHADGVSVRMNRWMRRHRTATSTIAVATLLLAIGGVFGSALWNIADVRKHQAEDERRMKKLELEIKDRQRLAELSAAATAAVDLAGKEIARDRFSSAYDVLRNTLPSIRGEQTLGEQIAQIQQQADRLEALVDFYRLSDVVEQQNVLSRDTKALMAGTTALKRLGIWERSDWWAMLPDRDLSPSQIDRLRWDVYQQLMLMDAMLIKTMGVRLAGDGGPFAWANTIIRMVSTDAGQAEAEAALIVSDRLDRFRLSQSSRFYRSVANARLSDGDVPEAKNWLIDAKELDLPENGADAHSLAVLSMIAEVDPGFQRFFKDYQSDDPLIDARNLFARCATLRPNYYGSHLGLGQVEYMIGKRNPQLRWEDLNHSLHAFGQCITLLPQRCFAFADRSSIYRAQARLIRRDSRYEATERERRATERLQWSLADAERALRSYDEHPWVGWQVGLASAEIGQVERAIGLWIKTALDTFPLGRISDRNLVKVDDLRGRAEIGDWLQQQLSKGEAVTEFRHARGFTALAGVRLNQTRDEEALGAVQSALQLSPRDPDALAIRGTVLLRAQKTNDAQNDFESALEVSPNHALATFGLARCLELTARYQEASDGFHSAQNLTPNSENQAAAALGRSRSAAFNGDFQTARQAVLQAIEVEPACDLYTLSRAFITRKLKWQRDPKVPREQIDGLTRFSQFVAALPRATKVQAMPPTDSSVSTQASILNGGFELGSLRYWNTAGGAQWESTPGYDAAVNVSDSVFHSGGHSLRIRMTTPTSPTTRSPVAGTAQHFSVLADQPYELSCWVKAESLDDGTAQLLGTGGEPLLELQGGTYDWRRVTGQLIAPSHREEATSPNGGIVAADIRIVVSGSGTLWIDEIVCRSVVSRSVVSPDARP